MIDDEDDDDEIELTEEEEAAVMAEVHIAHEALMASSPEYRSVIERIMNAEAANEARPSQSVAKKLN